MKKYVQSLLLCVALLFTLLAPSLAVNTATDPFSAVYEGYYYATQGQTGVTLTVTGDTAKFEFYNLPGRSNAKSGSYTMSVSEEDGVYALVGTEWIDHPSGYSFVDLEGTLSGKVFSGTVFSTSSSDTYEFYMERPTDAFDDLQNSIFNDHRYTYVGTAMTWDQAKAYCTEQGGYLATVTSAEEAEFLNKLLSAQGDTSYWLGGTGNDAGWRWENGESWSYGAAPTTTGHLKTSNAGAWSAGTETEQQGFVCEWGTWSESSTWASAELQRASDAGLIPEALIGEDMTQRVTRGEFAAVVVKLYEAMTGGRAIIAAECPFTDIDEDANRLYVLKAYNLDLVNGIGGNRFAPGDSLTREQMATMLCRTYKLSQNPFWTLETDGSYPLDVSGVPRFADDGDISSFAQESVYFMVQGDIIQGIGDNRFAPKNSTTQQEATGYANATREQAVALSLRSLEKLK